MVFYLDLFHIMSQTLLHFYIYYYNLNFFLVFCQMSHIQQMLLCVHNHRQLLQMLCMVLLDILLLDDKKRYTDAHSIFLIYHIFSRNFYSHLLLHIFEFNDIKQDIYDHILIVYHILFNKVLLYGIIHF